MSFTMVDADAPPAVIVRVSAPSVITSLTKVAEMVARPLELMTALPVNRPPEISALFTPDRV